MVNAACEEQNITQSQYRFSRKQIRDYTGWSDSQLKIHCYRLQDFEYLQIHGGSRGHFFYYELIYNGDINSDQPHLMGLIDVDALKKYTYDSRKLGVNESKLGPSQGQVSPQLGSSSGDENQQILDKNSADTPLVAKQHENAHPEQNESAHHTDTELV
jgi:hypothetical protein